MMVVEWVLLILCQSRLGSSGGVKALRLLVEFSVGCLVCDWVCSK